jgi:hypothetical protein
MSSGRTFSTDLLPGNAKRVRSQVGSSRPGLLEFMHEDLIEAMFDSKSFLELGEGAAALARAARSCRTFGLVANSGPAQPGSPAVLRLSPVDMASRAHCHRLGIDRKRDGWTSWTHMLAWVTSAMRVAPLPTGLPKRHPALRLWKQRQKADCRLFSSIADAVEVCCTMPSSAPSGADQLLIVEPGVYEEDRTVALGAKQRIAIWAATCSSFSSQEENEQAPSVVVHDEPPWHCRSSGHSSAAAAAAAATGVGGGGWPEQKNDEGMQAGVVPGARLILLSNPPPLRLKGLKSAAHQGQLQGQVAGQVAGVLSAPRVTWRSVDATTVVVKGSQAALELRGVRLEASKSAGFDGDGFCGIGCWQAASVRADGCDLTSHSLSVVECGDCGSEATLTHCALHDCCDGAGLYVYL